ncbi:uncharacterized protein LOC131231241 [Magnolia sinica]|uniref:uncharacterized protein LOC131231241 n=1 Tax=Magnolia sinica TaxID=86752 RepID=UPI002657DF94|nr:uncharacterized protein LOC131231241 [Magnolia sinica]
MDETHHPIQLPLLLPSKIKRSFSFLFFFFPTSILLLLILLLLACNGVSIFCLRLDSLVPTKPISSFPKSSSFLYAVEEQIPPALNKTHQSLQLSFAPSNASSSSRRLQKWPSSNRPVLKILQQTPRSRRFSARAKEFFGGSSSACSIRFFMTWISSLESFGRRELFAVESIFKSHPNACLLIISSSMDSTRGARLLRPFSSQGFRVSAISPDFASIFKDTGAEVWFNKLKNGNVNPGEVPLGQNLSNLLRLAVLYKFGGIYIDTDIIVMKSFSSLRNVIGAQTIDVETGNWSRLNNAVMVFDKKHPLLYKFIKEFTLTFDGNKWGHNGPYLVSRVVSRLERKPGFDFTVLRPTAFYPVVWSRIRSLFHGPRDKGHSKWAKGKLAQIRKESFAIHLWNRQSRRLKVEEGSVIGRVMLDCCIFCNSSLVSSL